ncbi:MAG: response regulator transcription factor [Clostridia bacterium]|nr:response regulator transcription factor [Clostridia bacterium]
MKTIVLDMQSVLYAKAVRRILAQDLDELQVDIATSPKQTVGRCMLLHADVLIMEVTPFIPWCLSERIRIREQVREGLPQCKIVLLVDEKADRELLQEVKRCSREGAIDAFLFTSVPESYLVAVVDSL